jgi:release factor glutamine methyltransferase
VSAAPATVEAALECARRLGVARLDAQLLLGHHLGRTRTWLAAHGEAGLTPELAVRVATDLARRADGEPLAYVLEEATFRGLRLAVSPAVLIPRPETEALVDWGLQCMADAPAPRVLDLGTGSGAIVLALGAARPDARLHASDASAAALAIAQANATRLGRTVHWALGPWWEPWVGTTFDLVLANPPYVAPEDPHLAALRHEPASALVAADGGLADLRAIVEGACAHLRPGGWLLLEHGHDQGAAVRELLRRAGLVDVSTRQDLADLDRCTAGQRADTLRHRS